MADLDRIIRKTKRLESLLKKHYRAKGKGLHQLISDVESRLPNEYVSKLRFIATIRNKAVHEDDFIFENKKDFYNACRECERELTPRGDFLMGKLVIILLLASTLLALMLYYVFWEDIIAFLNRILS